MQISRKDWNAYIKRLSSVNNEAAEKVKQYVDLHGLDDVSGLVNYSYRVVQQYGNASASLAALMYDTVADLEGKILKPAELAPLPDYGEVAKTVQGTLKTSQNVEEISSAVSRLVKRTGQDTILWNAERDGAQFAWIPSGDTCAFCIALASRGWQYMSRKALKNGHAEHIHSNCDCTYMIRHTSNFDVAGYDPDEYYEMYKSGAKVPYENENMSHSDNKQTLSTRNINGMRRRFYQENKEEILESKADRYEERKLLESSAAEETNVN